MAGLNPIKASILFVCVENSCRSQMAEGFARALGGGGIRAASAGSRPSGKVNETAIAVMREKGIDLRTHRSKSPAELPGVWDYLVTMGCGDACPVVPARARYDWPIPDPKSLPEGGFRKVRDHIEAKVVELLKKIQQGDV
jgi:protein-tyrosine-phosphatase